MRTYTEAEKQTEQYKRWAHGFTEEFGVTVEGLPDDPVEVRRLMRRWMQAVGNDVWDKICVRKGWRDLMVHKPND